MAEFDRRAWGEALVINTELDHEPEPEVPATIFYSVACEPGEMLDVRPLARLHQSRAWRVASDLSSEMRSESGRVVILNRIVCTCIQILESVM